MKAGIVDYRMGNLASVSKALARAGAEPFVSDDQEALEGADLLVLPGVGNFAAGMTNLSRLRLTRFIKEWASSGKPMLGICLGMQLLFERSEEGDTAGLGILPGKVVRIAGDVKVPHMGWNNLHSPAAGMFAPDDGKYFYFDHSYVCAPSQDSAVALTTYGDDFVSAVVKDNLTGVQFHPEKSGADGLDLLGRLVRGR